MTDVTASRTLVKSPPELWTECSQAESLARHLDSFGEIRITRLEPESAVAWEGELASGTVRLEPSGWGTRVVMTATRSPAPVAVEGCADAVGEGAPEPAVDPPAAGGHGEVPPTVERSETSASGTGRPARGVGSWLRRLFGRRRGVATTPAEPVAAPPDCAEELPETRDRAPSNRVEDTRAAEVSNPAAAAAEQPAIDTAAVLSAALESLGQAHHRPFSRV